VGMASGDVQGQGDVPQPRVRVFINYRHEDVTHGAAQFLYDRLASRFDNENLFLDRRSLQPGTNWWEEVKSRSDSCHVFLALIGSRWTWSMQEREKKRSVHPAEDYVLAEIQRALRLLPRVHVIPVLVGNNVTFAAEDLPRSVRALAKLEVARIRDESFEADIELLISKIDVIAREQPAITPEAVTAGSDDRRLVPMLAGAQGVALPPDDAHYEDVLQQMVDEGNLVLFLGSQMAAGRAGAPAGPPSRPDASELAAALADRFGINQLRPGLPEIAQYVYMTKGRSDLYRALRELLKADCEPGPVHRFLARFPRTLEELGLEKRYQLIISTNFDRALEQAFEEEMEPYDLAVYMASGPDEGKFVHFPFEGDPEPIDVPNKYWRLPLGDDLEVKRTLIVKIHGAVDGKVGDYSWQRNYVITEDHYIDYLSKSPITQIIPTQVLGKLKESHCLFLGYPVCDWTLRVFLKRIWEGSLDATSWAVDPDPDVLAEKLWTRSNVDLYAADPGVYVDLLRERLSSRPPKSSVP
jgi:hypothetical protein